jgi:hypothetical protein
MSAPRRLSFIVFATFVAFATTAPLQAQAPSVEVYFSPHGGCTDAIIRELAGARESIRVQAFSLTSTPIAKALLDAKNRGVKVEVVLDKSNVTAKDSGAAFLRNMGIVPLIDDKHAIANSNVILVDNRVIITGSFNFSPAAEESNSENLLLLRNHARLLAQYLENFRRHQTHSIPYVRPKPKAAATAPKSAPKRKRQSFEDVPKADSEADKVVYITNSNVRYHTAECRLVQDGKGVTLDDAKAHGYTPCSLCRPFLPKLKGPRRAKPPRPSGGPTVYVTRTGDKYHRVDCQHIGRSRQAISLSDARARGLAPCKTCKP